MAAVKTQKELYDIFKLELQNRVPGLTDFSDGSINDALGGVVSFVGSIMSQLTVDEFAKTFFDSANGPAVTGGPDDLQTLAVDHYGSSFARPSGTYSGGTIRFSRPDSTKGNVVIGAGTVVATRKDASGVSLRFSTLSPVTLTGLTIDVACVALAIGSASNVVPGAVALIETTLTDSSVVVTNLAGFSGGSNPYTDAEYREFIRAKIATLKGAVKASVLAAALSVAGVVTANIVEVELPVIDFNIATGLPVVGAKYFRVTRPVLYVADNAGAASSTLIASVKTAIAEVKALGVFINVEGATALVLAWTATLTLNSSGPAFAEFSTDLTRIKDSMKAYISALPIGAGFDKAAAEAAILAQFGPAGTSDITTFTSLSPVANVAGVVGQKIIPGIITLS